ncbi:MAG: AmmeMemoRadiSam system protein B [Planctomycetes bacterium]|nr:AmmeMemoRadiSam system protein B [Planctomycetota bacterium]
MRVRAAVATQFYPTASPETIESYLRGFQPPQIPEAAVAGIVPHAGWVYSGSTAARTLATIRERARVRAIVLLGAVHRVWIDRPAIYPSGAWETPFGALPVDSALAESIAREAGDGARLDAAAHEDEHSIEVQLPFVRYLFGELPIVPIAVPPEPSSPSFGEAVGRAIAGCGAVVVASTDLTHYGEMYGFAPAGLGDPGRRFLAENDRRIVDLAIDLDAEGIVPEARAHHNACGAGAMAAAVAAARTLGAERGVLVQYTTSHEVRPERVFSMAVGYAGIVF